VNGFQAEKTAKAGILFGQKGLYFGWTRLLCRPLRPDHILGRRKFYLGFMRDREKRGLAYFGLQFTFCRSDSAALWAWRRGETRMARGRFRVLEAGGKNQWGQSRAFWRFTRTKLDQGKRRNLVGIPFGTAFFDSSRPLAGIAGGGFCSGVDLGIGNSQLNATTLNRASSTLG